MRLYKIWPLIYINKILIINLIHLKNKKNKINNHNNHNNHNNKTIFIITLKEKYHSSDTRLALFLQIYKFFNFYIEKKKVIFVFKPYISHFVISKNNLINSLIQ